MMREDKTLIYATREEMGRGIDMRIMTQQREDGSASYVENLTMNTVGAGERIPVCIKLTNEEAKYMIDSLWQAGVRPSNGEGSSGQLAATQSHLEDMRTIAFKTLDIVEAK